jgi:hypothetical protein
MASSSPVSLVVPPLEVEHARSQTGFECVEHYVEYPHDGHPVLALQAMLDDLGVTGPYRRR